MKSTMKKKNRKEKFIKWFDPFKLDDNREDDTAIAEYIKKVSDNTVVSRIDGIISKESVAMEDSTEPIGTTMLLANEADSLNILKHHSNDEGEEYTIVYICNRKHINDIFDIVDGIHGTLAFHDIFLEADIVKRYNSLNIDADGNVSTSVIYIPGLIVNRGRIPFHYNILIVVEPTHKELIHKYTNAYEDISSFDMNNMIISNIIMDVFEACIRLGCKDIIVNPYGYKPLQKADYWWVGSFWKKAIGSKKVKNNLYSITLSSTSDNQYVGFIASKLTSEVNEAFDRLAEIHMSDNEKDTDTENKDDIKKTRHAKIVIE